MRTFVRLMRLMKNHRSLMINQGKIELDVGQLSDGERGMLALVLDLARRLSQANPSLDDPLSEGHALVLIDELDLHLHPKWQRQIVHKLTKTFPRCQFIATTHSPQVIGEVPHERIQIISDGDKVYSPTLLIWSRFKPGSWKRLWTRTHERTEIKELLSKISQVIGEEHSSTKPGD